MRKRSEVEDILPESDPIERCSYHATDYPRTPHEFNGIGDHRVGILSLIMPMTALQASCRHQPASFLRLWPVQSMVYIALPSRSQVPVNNVVPEFTGTFQLPTIATSEFGIARASYLLNLIIGARPPLPPIRIVVFFYFSRYIIISASQID